MCAVEIYLLPPSLQLQLHGELSGCDQQSLSQLLPEDLSESVTWLSSTVIPFLLNHAPQQLVHTHTHTHTHTLLTVAVTLIAALSQGGFLALLQENICSLELRDKVCI